MGKPASRDALLANAVQLHRAGDLAGAIRGYEKVVRKAPGHAVALNLLGLASFQAGKPEKAAASIEKALSLKPDLTDAHYNLGIVLHALGRYENALPHFTTFLAAAPQDAEARNSLGASLKELGRYDEAIEQFRQAIAIRPNYAEAHFNLGSALLAQGRHADAIPHLQQAAALHLDFAEAYSQLGNALLGNGRSEDAVRVHRRALALKPNDAEIHYGLANALWASGDSDEALRHYDRALALKPDFTEAHQRRGTLLTRLERYEEALASLDKVIAIDAAYPDAYIAKGATLRILGNFTEAAACFEKAIAVGPKKVEPYFFLADMKRIAVGDGRLAAMEEMARVAASFSKEEQIQLHFALGQAYSASDPQRSLGHFIEANAIRRSETPYDETETLRFFEQTRAVFTADLMHEKRGLGDPSAAPIFIVGMPRSGTSLVEQILASHPQVFGAGERDEFIRPALALRSAESIEFPEIVGGMSGDDLRQFGAEYLRKLRRIAPAAQRITDKLPANFLVAGLIHLTLPNARIIHTRRDPLDNCISCFTTLFENAHPFMNELSDLGRYYRAYEMLMDHWRRVLPERVMLEVQYEDVVGNLEGQARRIIAHCGFEWDDTCLAFHQTRRPVRTASVEQVRQPIYRSSIGRARVYGDQLRPLIEALGIE